MPSSRLTFDPEVTSWILWVCMCVHFMKTFKCGVLSVFLYVSARLNMYQIQTWFNLTLTVIHLFPS